MAQRCHLILVPGFGGFDALGRVEYYAGVTELFHAWKTRGGLPVSLHYFDTLPTAAVVTRADRLLKFVAKLCAREVIQARDRIVLVGHSTGGLDIRQFVCDINQTGDARVAADGRLSVPASQIRGCLDGVVFLSVPHWGTNIADWVHTYPLLRAAVIRDLQVLVAASQSYTVDQVETRLADVAAWLSGSALLRACRDTLTEANANYGEPGPTRTAEAQEAAADLALYFRQMTTDFRVIHDLMSQLHRDAGGPTQFDERTRESELKAWSAWPLRTVSYATVGARIYPFEHQKPAPVWDLLNPFTYPGTRAAAESDLLYGLCYRACAGGPLRMPSQAGRITRFLGPKPEQPLELWDNDGIVNTVSMLWPTGEVVGVMADHLDIVGHFETVKASNGGTRNGREPARVYRAYDAFRTVPAFTRRLFREVWHEIFTFAAGPD